MSSQTPTRKSTVPRRSFGVDESALDDEETQGSNSSDINPARRFLGRISFGGSHRRPSFISQWRRTADEEGGLGAISLPERPPIPSALQPGGEVYTTPLPALSMIVLSIVRWSSFSRKTLALSVCLVRQCWGSFCLQTCQHPFYYSW
jgi:hypothetical protein